MQVKANAVTDGAGNAGPAALAPAIPFSRTVALLEAPGKPTGLRGMGARQAIGLSWTAPADDGGAAVTGHRIEVSATGVDDAWKNLVANTGSGATIYWHAEVGDGETLHYRLYTINAAGERDASDEVSATALAAPMPEVIDVTEDGRVSADDGVVLFYRLRPPPADPNVRRTLIAPYLLSGIEPTDENINKFLNASSGSESSADVNGDRKMGESDAVLILNVKAFPDLVGNGRPGSGFARYRQIFIRPFLTAGSPQTDEEMLRIIRFVRSL